MIPQCNYSLIINSGSEWIVVSKMRTFICSGWSDRKHFGGENLHLVEMLSRLQIFCFCRWNTSRPSLERVILWPAEEQSSQQLNFGTFTAANGNYLKTNSFRESTFFHFRFLDFKKVNLSEKTNNKNIFTNLSISSMNYWRYYFQ